MGLDFNTGYKRQYLRNPLVAPPRHWMHQARPKLYGSGRAAFIDIIQYLRRTHGVNRVLLPNWQFAELFESIGAGCPDVEISVYSIGADCLPDESSIIQQSGNEPSKTLVVLVDYFASVDGARLEAVAAGFLGWVVLDCVHSWPVSPLKIGDWPSRLLVVIGFRKLFWKACGALVFGSASKSLPSLPVLIPSAAPGFPRNLTLSPRWGILSGWLLRCIRLEALDSCLTRFRRTREEVGSLRILDSLRCPVELAYSLHPKSEVLAHWPDLWKSLSKAERSSAEVLRQEHPVIKRD